MFNFLPFSSSNQNKETRSKIYGNIIAKYGENYPRFEQFRFEIEITKINRKLRYQKRLIIVTDKALYNVKGSSFRRRIRIENLSKIIFSNNSEEFIIKVANEYDYHYYLNEPQRSYLFDHIKRSFLELSGYPLVIEEVDIKSLANLVIKKAELRKRKSAINDKNNNSFGSNIKYSNNEREENESPKVSSSENKQDIEETSKIFESIQKLGPDDFHFIKVIGRGNYGKVMLVRQVESKKLFAMKILRKIDILRKNQVEHISNERIILEAMRHPFLPRLRFAFQTPQKLYLVMDYYSGGELFFHLQNRRRFNEIETKQIGAMVLLALEHLHKYDIVYRDLKPENILLDQNGFIALADFGLAKSLSGEGRTFTFCGTAAYMSPEQLEGKPTGKESDWWAFGVLLFELAVGCTPFYDNNTQNMYIKIKNSPVRFPSWVSKEFKEITSLLLVRDPNRRLGTGEEGSKRIKEMNFFSGIEFKLLFEKKIDPFYKPRKLATDDDTLNFDRVFTEETPTDSFVNENSLADNPDFVKFTYMPDDNDEDIEHNEESYESN